MNIQFTDNSKEVLEAMQQAAVRALEKCGLTAERYAKKLCPVDTGNLRNSITHTVDEEEPAAYIGSNAEYSAYVELGTGKIRFWWSAYSVGISGRKREENMGDTIEVIDGLDSDSTTGFNIFG